MNVDIAQTNATANALINHSTAGVLTNLNEHLNELAVLAPRNEYFASNAVATSLGYTLLNQILWSYRKTQAAARIPEPTIDIFNDGFAEQYEERALEDNMEAVGHVQIPTFDALPFKGVYKTLLRQQIGNIVFAKDFPVRMPNEILHDMLSRENTELLANAYAAQAMREIKDSRAAAAISLELETQAKKQQQRNVPKHQAETDHVLGELQRTCPEQLDDGKWMSMPLWMQYKLTCSVFKQVVKAIANDTRANPGGSATRDRLLTLADTMQLELEAAARTPEIKNAFLLERLDERHELIKNAAEVVKVTKAAALAETADQ